MSVKLPEINIDLISSLDEAKHIIRQLLNTFELVLKRQDDLEKENILLKQEIARIKQQPRKPQFGNAQSSFSATKLLKKKTTTGINQKGNR